MAWVTPSNVATGDVLTASKWNQDVVENTIVLPRGEVARANKTSDQTGISAAADVSGLSVTFTAESTRIYKTTVHALVQQLTSGGVIWTRITDGSNGQKQQWFESTTANSYYTATMVIYESGLSGSVTRKVRAEAQTGTVSIIAAASYPAVIIVEDVGVV